MKNIYSAQDCISAFCEYMEVKAEDIGLSNNTVFFDPCGIENKSTAKDMLRCLIRANESTDMQKIWSLKNHVVNICGENKREILLKSTVFMDDASTELTDFYKICGGKTGTLTKYNARNIAFIVEIPNTNDYLACVIMYAEGKDSERNNRFTAAKQALDIAIEKYNDKNADVSDKTVCAEGVIVAVVPECDGNEYHAKIDILYEKNALEIKMPASMTKMLTSVIVFELAEDLDKEIEVRREILDFMPQKFRRNNFKAGDLVSIRDLICSMMLLSCNEAAYILADYVGNKLLDY